MKKLSFSASLLLLPIWGQFSIPAFQPDSSTVTQSTIIPTRTRANCEPACEEEQINISTGAAANMPLLMQTAADWDASRWKPAASLPPFALAGGNAGQTNKVPPSSEAATSNAQTKDSAAGAKLPNGAPAGTMVANVIYSPNGALNVKAFGAIGDGTSHPLSSKFSTLADAQAVYPHITSLSQELDWAAIQAANNAAAVKGREVYVPDGVYRLNESLKLAGGVRISGSGRGGSDAFKTTGSRLIQVDASKPIFMLSARGYTLDSLSLTGTEKAAPFTASHGSLISISNPGEGKIVNCRIGYATYLIIITGNSVQQVILSSNAFWFNSSAIHVPAGSALTDTIIEDNEFWSDESGIDNVGGTGFPDNLVKNNMFYLCKRGISIQSSSGNTITGNRFNDDSIAGIRLYGNPGNTVISGNVFMRCGKDESAEANERGGVVLRPVAPSTPSNLTVTGNTFSNNPLHDIFIANFDSTISDSRIVANDGKVELLNSNLTNSKFSPMLNGTTISGLLINGQKRFHLGEQLFTATGGVPPSWSRYTVTKIANGTSGCANANGCWQVNSGSAIPASAGMSQAVPLFSATDLAVERIRVKTVTDAGPRVAAAMVTGFGTTGNVNYYASGLTYNLRAPSSKANLLYPVLAATGADTDASTSVVMTIATTSAGVDQIQTGCQITVHVEWTSLP